MTNALETRGLGKRYGTTWGLTDCTFALPQGKIAALVGPNGAGKTTLLRMAAGLIRPTTGEVTVLGRSLTGHPTDLLPDIGYLDQERPLYKHFKVGEILTYGAKMNPRWNDQAARQWISELDIDLTTTVRKLSIGQQAQVSLVLSMAKEPRLLLLDEPVAALDPLARQRLMSVLMASVVERGCTVFLSSHVLSDLESVCDFVVILSKSRVQVADDIGHLLASHLILTGPHSEDPALPGKVSVISVSHSERQTRLLVKTDGAFADPRWQVDEPTLEEIVVAYLRDPEAGLAEEPVLAEAGTVLGDAKG